MLFYNNTILTETSAGSSPNVHWRNNLILGENSAPAFFSVVVGDPGLRVKTIGDCAQVLSSVLPALGACDVARVGETPQHDTFEYLRNAMSLAMKKGVIMISHEGLEKWGVQDCAVWLQPLVPEIPVEWIPSNDPFQVPSLIRN